MEREVAEAARVPCPLLVSQILYLLDGCAEQPAAPSCFPTLFHLVLVLGGLADLFRGQLSYVFEQAGSPQKLHQTASMACLIASS